MQPPEEPVAEIKGNHMKSGHFQGVHRDSHPNIFVQTNELMVSASAPFCTLGKELILCVVQQHPRGPKISLHDYFLVINLNVHRDFSMYSFRMLECSL